MLKAIVESRAFVKHAGNSGGSGMRAFQLLGIAAAMLAGATVGALGEDAPADIEKGRQIAEAHCVACHAIGVDDESALAEAPPFRDLGQSYDVEALEEALAEGIVTGHEDMPEIELDPQQITDFIGYLKSIQKTR